MKLTNRQGLPKCIVRAVGVDGYTPGREGSISVTTLLAPAYQKKLMREHAGEIEEDAADRIWSLMGQIGHAIAERSEDAQSIVEERLYRPLAGADVSGQIDLYEDERVIDFKFTTTYKASGSDDWTAQLNAYAWLMRGAGFPVKGAALCLVFKDWSKAKAVSADYPSSPVKMLDVPLWTDDQVEAFLTERIKQHTSDTPPPCTDEERWAKPAVFAVYQGARKTATKLHQTRETAEAHAAEIGGRVEERPATFPRCESYCAVAKFCPHFGGAK